MVDVLYNILERFSITKRLLCITTNNARNNGTIRKELEELLNNLDINNSWSSKSTKIVKTATEVGVRAIQDHKVIEWNTCWKCRLSEGTDDM